MNMMELERVVRLALGAVNLLDDDHARQKNDAGFNRMDGPIARSLLEQPHWTPRQLATAHKLARRYRGQHGDEIPDLAPIEVEGMAVQERARAREAALAATAGLPEWGLQWSAPRTLETRAGLRVLRTATPTEAFWAEWRANKDPIKAKGYSVANRAGVWEVAHWAAPVAAPAPADVPTPNKVEPVSIDESRLLPYQVPAVRAIVSALQRWGAALDGSDTGTGKTYMALVAMKALRLTPTVIAPKTVLPSWRRAAQHVGIRINAINYEKVRMGNTEFGSWKTEARNGRDHERFVWSADVKALIFDEVHRCKGLKTQNASMLVSARAQGIPTIAASATAAVNPLEMKALGFMLGLHGLRDFYAWAEAHGCYKNNWDGWEFGGDESDMVRIHEQIFPDRGTRVRVRDLGDMFPPTMITTRLVEVKSPATLTREYATLGRLLDEVHERSKTDRDGAEHLTAMLRARQVSEVQKLPPAIEMAEDALGQSRAVFICCCFDDSIDVLSEALGKHGRVEVVRGGQSARDRDDAIERFQRNESRILIANIRAGGVGISLHDLCGVPRTAIILPSWSAVELKQALGRIWRAGGRSEAVQYVLYAAGVPVEERVAGLLEEKLRRMSVFNDGLAELDIREGDL